MKNALILHGTGDNSESNWFPWLKRVLEQKGWKVWLPDLPQSDKPNIQRYNEFIRDNEKWKFNKDSYLIGHSSGAVAILGLLEHLPKETVVDACILVSAFKDDLGWEALNELFLKPLNFEKIKKHAKRFIFIHSDNDPYVPVEHAQYLSQQLGGKLLVLSGQKHFSISTSGPQYNEFPFLLDILPK